MPGTADQALGPGIESKPSAGPTSAGSSFDDGARFRGWRGSPPGTAMPGTASTGPWLRKGAASSTGGSSRGTPESPPVEADAGPRSGGPLCWAWARATYVKSRPSDRAVAIRTMKFPLDPRRDVRWTSSISVRSCRKSSIITPRPPNMCGVVGCKDRSPHPLPSVAPSPNQADWVEMEAALVGSAIGRCVHGRRQSCHQRE